MEETKVESVPKLEEPTSAPAPREQEPVTSPASKAPSSNQSPPASLDIDKTKPKDFDGEVQTTNEIPSAELLDEIENYVLLDRNGKTHTFKSLYTGQNVARRVLVIFVRHFFCGMCQEYLRTLSESITPDALLRLPVSTFITVIGCGDPALIDMYVKETGCPFPVYTDPTRSLFDALGMMKTLNMGERPAYAKKSTAKGILDSIVQGLKFVPSGLALKSGDSRQVGGEFLFEPLDIVTPVTTPRDEHRPQLGSFEEPGHVGDSGKDGRFEEKRVTWCHRMKTTRDHAEIPELMEVLGLDGQGQPISDEKRWAEAVQKRKGTGLSLASQMSQLKIAERNQPAEQTAPIAEEAKDGSN
ncbi:AhpC/TSA antioxidant enzyme domain-containing protein 1 [Cladobotryum mycophilum]|uniref:AhpC/TSA antioxidant enzyme domain-containing protein 1 n=1 Tax=Cladobotryum mycophilum TaxID=491253 RepID=A0ABR0SKF9_9HYPO